MSIKNKNENMRKLENIRNILIIFICFQIIMSCKENSVEVTLNNNAIMFNEFPREDTITFENLGDYKTGVPKKIFFMDSTLILFNIPKKSKHLFNNYSLKKGEFSKGYVSKGKGPGETIGASCAGVIDDKLWFYDISLNKVLITDKKKAIKNNSFYPFKEYKLKNHYSRIDLMDSLNFYGIGNFESTSQSIIEKTNLISNEKDEYYGEFRDDLNDIEHGTIKGVYNSSINIKPSGKSIVLGYRHTDLIEIYNLDSGKCIAVQGPEKYGVNFVAKKKTMSYMGKNEKTRKSFVSGTVTDNYIYLIYSGASAKNTSEENRFDWQYGKFIYVYDWEGNPVKKIILDRHIYAIGISDDDKTLYSHDLNTGYLIYAKIN
ncbi:MAG: hypothetical protein IZT56_14115 [Bacteroidetes bacterium]|nr:hypothetical protein [Bacteroidota bacterium]